MVHTLSFTSPLKPILLVLIRVALISNNNMVYYVQLTTISSSYNQNDLTILLYMHGCRRGGGLVVERRTPEREVGVRSSLRSPGCVLEQDTFTSQKYWLFLGSGGPVPT